MCCALRSAACSGMCAIWRAARRRAGTGSASSSMRPPAAPGRSRAGGLVAAARARRQPRAHEPADRPARRVGRRACGAAGRRALAADVLHGHGAKGGAYARLAAQSRGRSAPTRPTAAACTTAGARPRASLYLTLERLLIARTDLFLFESAYGRDVFRAKVGDPGELARACVHNGVTAGRVRADRRRSAGDRPRLRGRVARPQGRRRADRGDRAAGARGPAPERHDRGRRPGSGGVRGRRCAQQGLAERVRFVGAKPARAAFALGRLLVVPSRAESLPYIVLEAAAAGVPLIATRVGGIPEIFGPDSADLVPPGDPAALARAIGVAAAGSRRDTAPRRRASAGAGARRLLGRRR